MTNIARPRAKGVVPTTTAESSGLGWQSFLTALEHGLACVTSLTLIETANDEHRLDHLAEFKSCSGRVACLASIHEHRQHQPVRDKRQELPAMGFVMVNITNAQS